MRLQYRAKDRAGKASAGEIDAASPAEARAKLRAQGLFVLQIAAAAGPPAAPSLGLRRGVSKADLLVLLSQLTIMNQSGVDLAESLRNLAEQCGKPAMKAVLEQIYGDVASGVSLSTALKRHPQIFDETFVAVIQAGECSGTIPSTLERLTALIRGEIRLRSTILSMLMYPLVLCGVTVAVLAAMIFFVLPQFATVFVELGRSPPPLTSALLAVGAFSRQHLIEILLAAGGLATAWYFLRRTAPVKRARDYFFLHAAIVKNATRSLATGRLFRLLGTMLQTGVPLVDCIRLCKSAARNVFFRAMFDGIERDVLHGKGIAHALFSAPFLPLGAAHMVATAERSGRLGQVLQSVGEYYEDEGERQLRDIIKIAEPALILGLGAIVATVVLSIVLPLLDVSTLSH